ncbi:MAG: EF-P beta-lysylation protein EpmB [Piscirickettsiaceae bacterium]|nr:MAG: EF-P beta-lysylation protein EpmB [Piscirickettsiaceae bacterium]
MIHMDTVAQISNHQTWQQELASAFTTLEALLTYLELNIDDLTDFDRAHQLFPLLVTKSFASRIKKNDPADPLLKQVLPIPSELNLNRLYTKDPVGDDNATVLPGLIHKYHGRVLMIVTGACAIHCRYCFRRSFPYTDNSAHSSQLQKTIEYLQQNKDIDEVILSGGDPLTLNDQRLSKIINAIESVKHIKRLRIHTRLPIVLPSRVTDGLIKALTNSRLKLVLVLHINHPNEIIKPVREAINTLKNNRITLLNQSVLLKGVNDDANTLVDLSHQLFDNNIQPYYLHLLDKVEGAMHFDISREDARALYKKVQQKLPGYLVPKLVSEIPGEASKTLIS